MRAEGFSPNETSLTLRKVLRAEEILARKRADEHKKQMAKIEAQRKAPAAPRR